MGDASFIQGSFLGGEVSKFAQGRYSDPDYRTLMSVCFNGLPIEADVWVRRPGTHCVMEGRQGAQSRAIAFNFKQSAPYEMVFSDGYLRFVNGLSPVMTNDEIGVVSISTANPAVVTTNGNHGWATGNTTKLDALGATVPLLQNRQIAITVLSPTTFSIADAITGTSIDGSTLSVGSLSASAKVQRILEIATPYVGQLWQTLRSVQTDVQLPNGSTVQAVLLQGTIAPYTLTVATNPTPAAFATFTLAKATFKDGPYFDPVPGGTLATPSGLTGNINLTLSFNAYDATKSYTVGDYVTSSSVNYKSIQDTNLNNTPASSPLFWTPVAATDAIGPNGFLATDVGRHVRLFSEPPLWLAGTTYANTSIVAYNNVYWNSLVNGNTGNQPGLDITKWVVNPTGAIWTWGKITGSATLIDRALAGSASIGDMTANGGLAALFDGNTVKIFSASATTNTSTIPVGVSQTSYGGKNYSGASAQKILSGTLYPCSNGGFVSESGDASTHAFITINMRAKATLPANRADGTLLGTFAIGSLTMPANSFAPVTIVSNDQTTAWNYVWFEIIATNVSGQTRIFSNCAAQAQFYSPPGTGVTANGVTVQIIGDPLLYASAIRTWRLGLYSDTTGYPKGGTYHEGRLWLFGVVDNRIDGSEPNAPFSFAPTMPDGTVTSGNGVAYTFNAPDVNPIFWGEPDQLGIVFGTQAGEWLVQASANNNILTPTSIQAHRTSKNGCANIEPRRTGLTIAVVQRYTRELFEYFADVFSGKLAAKSLSKWIKHITASGVQEIAYQQELTPIIWQRMGDGSFAGQTYKRENLASSQPPAFMGAHRHALGSGRTVESICTGGNHDGTLDTLVMVTNDAVSNIRHIEVLTDIVEEGATLAEAAYLDDAINPTSTSTDNATPSPYGALTLNGLWPLNGKTVTAWIGGLDCGDYTVANGSITVPYGDGISGGTASGLFTAVFAATIPLSQMVVGFTFTSQGQIVRPNSPAESGTRNGPAFGKTRRAMWYAAELEGSQGVSFGTTFTNVLPAIFKEKNGAHYAITKQFTGIHWDTLADDYSFDGMICWQVTRPYICNVNTIGGFLHSQDR